MRFLSAHFSSLFQSLQIVALNFSVLTAPPAHFGIIYKFTVSALCPIIQIIVTGIEWYWPQYWPLRDTTGDSLLVGFCITHQHLLSLMGQ